MTAALLTLVALVWSRYTWRELRHARQLAELRRIVEAAPGPWTSWGCVVEETVVSGHFQEAARLRRILEAAR